MTKTSKAPETTWEQIGTVCVDTGTLTTGDRCQLVHLDRDQTYCGDAMFKQTEQLAHGRSGDKLLRTVVSLGIGDGDYAVMAEFCEGMIKTVVIDFLREEFCKAAVKHRAVEEMSK